jgi:hypothetical protein
MTNCFRVSLFTLFSLMIFSNSSSHAQNCDSILVNGMRNITVSQSSAAATASKYYNNCGRDFATSSDDVLARAEVEIFGEGSGNGSFTRAQRETSLHNWCTSNEETAKSHSDEYNLTQTVYSGSVQAWDNCNKLKSRDVVISPSIVEDGRTVTVSLRYTGATQSGVLLTGIDSEGFTCTVNMPNGEPFDSKKPPEIKNEAINIICKREQAVEKTLQGQTFKVLGRGVIQVLTASYPLQLYFAEEWNPALPDSAEKKLNDRMKLSEANVQQIVKDNEKLQKEVTVLTDQLLLVQKAQESTLLNVRTPESPHLFKVLTDACVGQGYRWAVATGGESTANGPHEVQALCLR